MTVLTLDKLVDFMLDATWDLLLAGTQPHPMWLLVGPGGSGFVDTIWRNASEKRAAVAAVAALVKADRSTTVVLSSDTWMRDIALDEEWDGVSPKDSPHSTEAIVVTGWDAQGRQLMRARRYRRADDGAIQRLDEETFEGGNFESDTFQPIVDALRTPGVQ